MILNGSLNFHDCCAYLWHCADWPENMNFVGPETIKKPE